MPYYTVEDLDDLIKSRQKHLDDLRAHCLKLEELINKMKTARDALSVSEGFAAVQIKNPEYIQ